MTFRRWGAGDPLVRHLRVVAANCAFLEWIRGDSSTPRPASQLHGRANEQRKATELTAEGGEPPNSSCAVTLAPRSGPRGHEWLTPQCRAPCRPRRIGPARASSSGGSPAATSFCIELRKPSSAPSSAAKIGVTSAAGPNEQGYWLAFASVSPTSLPTPPLREPHVAPHTPSILCAPFYTAATKPEGVRRAEPQV